MTDLVPVAGFLRQAFESEGLDFDDLLRQAGIAATPFHGGRLRVSTKQFFALWTAVEASGVPADFGLRLVRQPLPQQFDVAAAAALHSENLGAALAKLSRYKRLTCPEVVQVDLDDDEARVQIIWLSADTPVPTFLVDATFAALHRLAVLGTGQPMAPLRLEVTRPRDPDRLLARNFPCDVVLGSPSDALVFRRADLAVPFGTHNPDLLELLVPGLEAALKTRTRSTSVADHVRMALRRQMRGRRPSIDEVARELHVSHRTLQRRLGDEGTSYQRLLDEVRQDLARRLLVETELDTAEIAFVLGFEELNSFTRAFHGWEGTTPRKWRSVRLAS